MVLARNVKLGIQEKRAELEKQKAILVATIFRDVISELQLSRDKAAEATRLFSQKMLAISAAVED